MTGSPENGYLRRLLARERERSHAGLRSCVERAIEWGELRDDTDAAALAAVFDGFLVCLPTQARDGVPLAVLEAGVAALMGAATGIQPGRSTRKRATRGAPARH